jgi:hypothetical protein
VALSVLAKPSGRLQTNDILVIKKRFYTICRVFSPAGTNKSAPAKTNRMANAADYTGIKLTSRRCGALFVLTIISVWYIMRTGAEIINLPQAFLTAAQHCKNRGY